MPTSLGPAEILVILVVALIVLGPKRLPEAGRQVGKAIAEVRRWTTDVKSEIRSVIDVEPPAASTVVDPVVVSGTATSVTAEDDMSMSEVVQPVTVAVDEPSFTVPTESAPDGAEAEADAGPQAVEPPAAVAAEEEPTAEPPTAELAADWLQTEGSPADERPTVDPAVTATSDAVLAGAGATADPPTADPPTADPAVTATSDALLAGAQVEFPESPSGDPARI